MVKASRHVWSPSYSVLFRDDSDLHPPLRKGQLSSQRVCVGVDTSLQTALKGQLQSSTHFKESNSLLLTGSGGRHDGDTRI